MMKKFLSILSLAGLLCLGIATCGHATSFVYTLDIDIPDPGSITDDISKIAGVEFDVIGGVSGIDWELVIGDAVPIGRGNWKHEGFGTLNAIYDDYDWSEPEYAPMGSGNVLTINASVELTFSDPIFFDYEGLVVDAGYYTTSDIISQDPVPAPSAILLLGTGLIGILGITRRES